MFRTTPTASTLHGWGRAIHRGMSSTRTRVRPEHQAAQMLLRMSKVQRRTIQRLATMGGHGSTVAYVLAISEADARTRGLYGLATLLGGTVTDTDENGPDS